MGQPEHYSFDLPARCMRLFDKLEAAADEIFMPGQNKELGPLTATFALTMAIPIITLPCERIFKPSGDGVQYADDRQLNEGLTKVVKDEMNLPKLDQSVFMPHVWSFVKVDQANLFNLGEGLPYGVAQQLTKNEAFNGAANMPVSQWLGCLRNALAHGGIVYLNEDGMPSYGQPVRMFAFVSGKYNRRFKPAKLVGLNVLRISKTDFVDFLRNWVRWLQDSGIYLEVAA